MNYACADIDFVGEGYEVKGLRELGFFQGTGLGSISEFTNNQLFNGEANSKAIVDLIYSNERTEPLYYHGGAYFSSDSNANYQTLARYSNGKNAIVTGKVGNGRYLISGVHFELCPQVYEDYVRPKTNHINMQQEKQLLTAIRDESYGQLVFQEIRKLLAVTVQ